MSAPQTIIRLVETFRNNIESLKSGNYNKEIAILRQIDKLVYKLYGLTEEEIKIMKQEN